MLKPESTQNKALRIESAPPRRLVGDDAGLCAVCGRALYWRALQPDDHGTYWQQCPCCGVMHAPAPAEVAAHG